MAQAVRPRTQARPNPFSPHMSAAPPSRWREEWSLKTDADGDLVLQGTRIIRPQPYQLALLYQRHRNQADPAIQERPPLRPTPTPRTMLRCSGLNTCRPSGRAGHHDLVLYVERKRRDSWGVLDFWVGVTCPAPCPALSLYYIPLGSRELYDGLLEISMRAELGIPLKVHRCTMSDRAFTVIM